MSRPMLTMCHHTDREMIYIILLNLGKVTPLMTHKVPDDKTWVAFRTTMSLFLLERSGSFGSISLNRGDQPRITPRDIFSEREYPLRF